MRALVLSELLLDETRYAAIFGNDVQVKDFGLPLQSVDRGNSVAWRCAHVETRTPGPGNVASDRPASPASCPGDGGGVPAPRAAGQVLRGEARTATCTPRSARGRSGARWVSRPGRLRAPLRARPVG
ncbi:hypothetical protein [Propionicicella superfundia]|uniref:hypothetical protein n=1 Tax=Propionicicella superfundia TaxID=348582 RepID=UPI0012EC7D2A|nr:hypothetical protein [Propionicicella superfundia]